MRMKKKKTASKKGQEGGRWRQKFTELKAEACSILVRIKSRHQAQSGKFKFRFTGFS